MYEDYLKAKLLYEEESYFIDDSLFPFKRGDSGREVLYINLMLDELSHSFSELGRVDLKPYYSLSTENAVKEIRKIFLMEDDDVIDICLFERLRRELSVRGKNNIW